MRACLLMKPLNHPHTRAHAFVGAQMLRLSDVKKAAMHKWKTEQALQTEITRSKDTVSSL